MKNKILTHLFTFISAIVTFILILKSSPYIRNLFRFLIFDEDLIYDLRNQLDFKDSLIKNLEERVENLDKQNNLNEEKSNLLKNMNLSSFSNINELLKSKVFISILSLLILLIFSSSVYGITVVPSIHFSLNQLIDLIAATNRDNSTRLDTITFYINECFRLLGENNKSNDEKLQSIMLLLKALEVLIPKKTSNIREDSSNKKPSTINSEGDDLDFDL